MTRFSFVPFVYLREKFSFVVKIIFIFWQRLSRAGPSWSNLWRSAEALLGSIIFDPPSSILVTVFTAAPLRVFLAFACSFWENRINT
jgi:hypothetical protein